MESVQTGGTPPSDGQEYFDEGTFNWFTPGDFDDRLILQESKRKITLSAIENGTIKVFKPQSVLMIGIGATLGKIGICLDTCSSNQQINAITFNEYFDPFYGAYYLKSQADVIVSLANAATLAILNQSQTKDINFSCPPLPEQVAIARYLDTQTTQLDTLIDRKRRLIDLLREEKAALINEAVTKGINPNAPMKDSGIEWLGEVPAHWAVKKLKFVATTKARLGWKGLKADEYTKSGYGFIATPNIKGADIDYVNINFINEFRYNESPEIMLETGDVLLAKDGSTLGTVNVVQYLPFPTTVNSSIAILRIFDQQSLNANFLRYFISSDFQQNVIERIKDGMGVPHLFQEDIRNFTVFLPPIEEQLEIVKYINVGTAQINYTVSRIEREIELMQEYRTVRWSGLSAHRLA